MFCQFSCVFFCFECVFRCCDAPDTLSRSTIKTFLSSHVSKFIASPAKINFELEAVLMHPQRSSEFHKFARSNYLEETTMFYQDVEVFKKVCVSVFVCFVAMLVRQMNTIHAPHSYRS